MSFRWSFHAAILMAFLSVLALYFTSDSKFGAFSQWIRSTTSHRGVRQVEATPFLTESRPSTAAQVVPLDTTPLNEAPDSNSLSSRVQISPLPSIATQILLNVGWQIDRNLGLRSLRGGQSDSFLGPSAIRSYRGRLIIVDTADGRVVHLDSEGKIVESISLPVSNPRKLYLNDDGSLVFWEPGSPEVLYRSQTVLGEIQNQGRSLGWQKIKLPAISDAQKKSPEYIIPARIFQINDVLYVEHDDGQLHQVGGHGSVGLQTLPGRPTAKEDVFVSARLVNQKSGSLIVQALDTTQRRLWQRTLQFSGTDLRILAVEPAIHHHFIVVAVEMTKQNRRVTVCTKVDLSGRIVSALELGQTLRDGYDVQDPILVDDKNSFLHMVVSLSGVTIERHAWK